MTLAVENCASMNWCLRVWLFTSFGGELHRQMHRSSLSATCRLLKRSPRRGPSSLMMPLELHAEQNTSSPSRAIFAPSMDISELAEVTVPPAVVVAPKVMW